MQARSMLFVLTLIVILLSGCALSRGPVLPTTYYVATTGNDSNAGTEAAPFRTIAWGSRALAAGDTLLIRQGTYNEVMINGQNGFVFCNGTSASAMTRYAAYPGEEGKVIVKAPSGAFVVVFALTTAYVEVSGLVLDGTNASSYVVKFDGSYGKNLWAHNNRLINNELVNGRMGISNGGYNEMIGNKIHHMEQYGIYTAGDNGLMEGNIFHDNGGFGIHLFQQDPAHAPNNWVIRNNVFFNNGSGYGRLHPRKASAIIISRGHNNQVYNNLVYNNHAGIFVGYGASDTLVANNTVYGNDTYGIEVSSSHSGSLNARVINNIVWGNTVSQITDTGTNSTLRGNVTTDPNFVNAAGGDFHLQAGSPAIDAGVTLSEVLVDMAGGTRPSGSAYDAGAFEFNVEPDGSKTYTAPHPAH